MKIGSIFRVEKPLHFIPDQKFLMSIGEVGVRVFPNEEVAENSFVGIDDFILVPTVEGPVLTTSLSDGNFNLGFTPNPGVSTTIERLTQNFTWREVMGQSNLTGPQIFSTPLKQGPEIFRVAARERSDPDHQPVESVREFCSAPMPLSLNAHLMRNEPLGVQSQCSFLCG